MERKVSENGSFASLQQHLSRLGLPTVLCQELVENHARIDYLRHSIIFLEKSPADLLFWLESGLVKISSPISDGSRFVVHLAGPGEILGAACINVGGLRVQAFEAEAFTKCSIAPITREHIVRILGKLAHAELLTFLETLNAEWTRVFAEFVRFLGLPFKERLYSVLTDFSARFGVSESRGVLLTPELSHDDFAEMIGSSRPMASRLLSGMIEEGTLLRDGRRYILRVANKGGPPRSEAPPNRLPPGRDRET